MTAATSSALTSASGSSSLGSSTLTPSRVLVLPNTKEDGAEVVLEKVRDRFRRVAGARGWAVDLTAGTVTYDQAPRSADEMVDRADAVLYAAKRGRQRQDA